MKNFNDVEKNLRSIFLGTVSVLDVYSMTSTSPQSGAESGQLTPLKQEKYGSRIPIN